MFIIQKQKTLSREAITVLEYCIKHKLEYKFEEVGTKATVNDIPIGTVKFCEQALGYTVTPDYYPDFLKSHLFREVWKSETWIQEKGLFVKPARCYKQFTGFITKGKHIGQNNTTTPYWYSLPVNFINEWRYYIVDGTVLTAGWYSGNDESEPAPKLRMKIPATYCGALDFGRLDTGEFALVESQHPYAIGWYGESKDNSLYVSFLVNGWKYMQSLRR